MRWLRRWRRPVGKINAATVAPPLMTPTDFSATVFSGNQVEWVSYLSTPVNDRRDVDWQLSVQCGGAFPSWCWQGFGATGRRLAEVLPWLLRGVEQAVAGSASGEHAWQAWVQRRQDEQAIEKITGSHWMPTSGAREVAVAEDLRPRDVVLVFRHRMVEYVLDTIAQSGLSVTATEAAPLPIVGRLWMFLWRFFVICDLENAPRDRFLSRIQVGARLLPMAVCALYEGKRYGVLVPNAGGEAFHLALANTDGYDPQLVQIQHDYLKLLNNCSYFLHDRLWQGSSDLTETHIRAYLDPRYLRLSIASSMPVLSPFYQALPSRVEKRDAWVEPPRIGHGGVHDRDDLAAWRAVEGPLYDRGFAITRQLGMGQFGRVYEAITLGLSHLPSRVAVKVARKDGKKWQTIPDNDVVMRIANDLSGVAHLMRQYDGGRLPRLGVPYHVLQLIDGETVDHLVGIAGHEHASMEAGVRMADAEGARRAVTERFRRSAVERWRGERQGHRFLHGLSFAATLDVIVSMLLWLEAVHQRGYVVNDLKNGNMMLNRRGQLKGIDLDAFAPRVTRHDQLADFMFMAMSLVMFSSAAPDPHGSLRHLPDDGLRDRQKLAQFLNTCWELQDNERSGLWALADTVHACATGELIGDAPAFTARINDLIRVKRQLRVEELVMD